MAAITEAQALDLARYAFGPSAKVMDLQGEQHDPAARFFVRGVTTGFGASWADAFSLAGWDFPPPPKPFYVQLGADVLRNGEVITTAKSNSWARRIAEALNLNPHAGQNRPGNTRPRRAA